jgi:hypothetical protein
METLAADFALLYPPYSGRNHYRASAISYEPSAPIHLD